MCKAPKPPAAPTQRRPSFLINPVTDSAEGSTIGQLRIGRSSLRTDLDQTPVSPIKVNAPQFIPERFRQDELRLERLQKKAAAKDGFGSLIAAGFAQSLQNRIDNPEQ